MENRGERREKNGESGDQGDVVAGAGGREVSGWNDLPKARRLKNLRNESKLGRPIATIQQASKSICPIITPNAQRCCRLGEE